MGKLTYLVLHCTATPEGRSVTSDQIRSWHTSPPPQGRGWKQVGYSAMIHLDGRLEILTPFDEDDEVEKWELTNGVVGINSISRHIVYVGGTDKNGRAKDTRTQAQRIAIDNFVKQTIAAHPSIKVAGHNQWDSRKACPCFDVPTYLRSIGVDEVNIHK